MVRHRAVTINNRLIDIPSYLVKVGDVLQIAKGAQGWAGRVKVNLEKSKDRPQPAWVDVDAAQQKGTVVRLPQKDDLGLPIQEQLIVELYSK